MRGVYTEARVWASRLTEDSLATGEAGLGMRTSGGNAIGTFNGRMLRLPIPLLLAVGFEAARAETFVAVADVSRPKFQLTPDSKVYLRNHDTCSASALGLTRAR